MNYRDIVLKLLKKRSELTVVEETMLLDFSHFPDPALAFEQWCKQNYIVKTSISGSKNIILSKSPKDDPSKTTSKDLEIQDD